MHKIEATVFGFKIVASGVMDADEMEQLKYEIIHTLSEYNKPFSLFVDIRELVPLNTDVLEVVKDIHQSCKKMSLERTALVINSPVLKQQAVQIGFEALTTKYDRIIDSSKVADWEEVAIAWVAKGIEPVQSAV